MSGAPAVRCDVRRQVADTPGAGRVARPPRSPVQSAMRSPLVCGEGAPACVGCGARTTRRRWCGFPAAPRIQATVPRSRNTARRPPFPGQRRDARARGQPHPRLWVTAPLPHLCAPGPGRARAHGASPAPPHSPSLPCAGGSQHTPGLPAFNPLCLPGPQQGLGTASLNLNLTHRDGTAGPQRPLAPAVRASTSREVGGQGIRGGQWYWRGKAAVKATTPASEKSRLLQS